MTLGLVAAAMPLPAQDEDSQVSRPAPRLPDGRISLTGPPGEIGNWDGPPTATLANRASQVESGDYGRNLPTNLLREDVPFQPWARELYEHRQATFTKDDPHTRCKPSGGARMFHTPYGFEILDLGDEIIFVGVGAPHSWRTVHMDGREHPEDPTPTWYGHSVGRWDGDTLVIEVTGQNDRTWFDRSGNFHSAALQVTERFTPTSPYTVRYEARIEDANVFTEPWHIDMTLYRRVGEDAQLQQFKCIEFVEELMYGHLRKEPLR